MEPPKGLEIDLSLVCKLKKSLYGLKQANQRFINFLKDFSFIESDADPCVFRGTIDNESALLALFVDDGPIVSKSSPILCKSLKSMKQTFDITIGNQPCLVGVEIKRDNIKKKMFIQQYAYTCKIIDKFE